jgi:hypothetical protein
MSRMLEVALESLGPNGGDPKVRLGKLFDVLLPYCVASWGPGGFLLLT